MAIESPSQRRLVSCPKCNRNVRADAATCTYCGATIGSAVLNCPSCNRINREGSTKCMFCGTQFVAQEAASDVVYDVSCEQCGRAVRVAEKALRRLLESGTRCQYCRGPLRLPEVAQSILGEIAEQRQREVVFDFPCPGCERNQRSKPDGAVACQWCGLRCLAPKKAGGNPRLGPTSQAPAPDADEFRKTFANVPRSWVSQLLRDALLARARIGELATSEMEPLIESLSSLNGWSRATPEPFLPLAQNQVVEVLGPALEAEGQFTDDSRGMPELVLILLQEKPGKKLDLPTMSASTLALNAVGVGLLSTLGVGFTVSERKEEMVERLIQHKLRLAMRSTTAGTWLAPSYQLDDYQPLPLPAEQTMEFAKRLWNLRRKLFSYFLVMGLYGPWAKGRPAFRVTKGAITRRMKALGLAEELVGRGAGIVASFQADAERAG